MTNPNKQPGDDSEHSSPSLGEFTPEMAEYLFGLERDLNDSLVRAEREREIHGGLAGIATLDAVRGIVDDTGLDKAFEQLDNNTEES